MRGTYRKTFVWLALVAAVLVLAVAAPLAVAAGAELRAASPSAEFLRYQADVELRHTLGLVRNALRVCRGSFSRRRSPQRRSSRSSSLAAVTRGAPGWAPASPAVAVAATAVAGTRALPLPPAGTTRTERFLSLLVMRRVMCASQRRWRTVWTPTPAATTTPLRSWIVCQTAVLTPRITAWPPLEMLTVSAGNSRMMPVTAQNRKATPVTMSTQ